VKQYYRKGGQAAQRIDFGHPPLTVRFVHAKDIVKLTAQQFFSAARALWIDEDLISHAIRKFYL
jgi:hypothetical protein